jgi:hypothetical protein
MHDLLLDNIRELTEIEGILNELASFEANNK